MILFFKKNRVERVLHKSLPYFFTLVFITTIFGAWSGYLEHQSFKMGDWLINYQGGFVRRGLLGEVVYQLAYFTQINPGIYILLFQIFLYAVYLFFSYLLLQRQEKLLPYIFLIFSPFIFTFQINDLGGGYRKEIIYFALLAFIVWVASVKSEKTFEKIFYILLTIYPAVILTHESLAIFLPYILVVYILVARINTKKLIFICLLLIPSIISFLFVLLHSQVSIMHIQEIFDSLRRVNYPIGGGAIAWLDKSSSYGREFVKMLLYTKNYEYYSLFVVLAAIAYLPIYERIKLIFTNKLSLYLILFSVIGSVGLFIVAVDWGRFINIHLISIFLLSLLPLSKLEKRKNTLYRWVNKYIYISIFLVYVLFWHIPHYGSPFRGFSKNLETTNIMAFKKPYEKVYKYLSEIKILKISPDYYNKSSEVLFDLKDKKFQFHKLSAFSFEEGKNGFIYFKTNNNDPIMILDKVRTKFKQVILSCTIKTDKQVMFQLYYKKNKKINYNETDSYAVFLDKGMNTIRLLIPKKCINNNLRVDLVDQAGTYEIYNFSIYGVKNK